MRIQVGLELNNDNHAIAWALDYPGCFAYGKDGSEAVVALAKALVAYEDWVTRRGGPGWLELGDFDLRLVDTWQDFTINAEYELAEDGYQVEAWFLQDWKPLSPVNIERGISLLNWSRIDLLQTVQGLSDPQLDQQRPGERWSIREILKHVANAEWWYLTCLGLQGSPAESLPEDERERLQVVRRRLLDVLPDLAGRELVVGNAGELWSPRKLLRRALWHEKDHTLHILKLRF